MAYLDRDDYEMIECERATASGVHHALLDEFFADRYPKSTGQAATELFERGLAGDQRTLLYLIEAGTIPRPAESEGPRGRARLRWYAEDIDRAAAALDAQEKHSALGTFWKLFDIDPFQDAVALCEAIRHGLSEPYLRTQAVVTISPALPGVGIPAEVTYIVPDEEHMARRFAKGRPDA